MINICIILMTHNKKSDINYIKLFKNSFKRIKNVQLFFIKWNNKNLINFIIKKKIKGIILSGSKYRILKSKNANISTNIFKLKIPILGICYGYQWLITKLGNKNYINSHLDEKNHTYYKYLKINKPFKIKKKKYFLNHFDYIKKIPSNWFSVIKYKNQILMSYDDVNKYIGIQFHPEKNKNTGYIFYKKWIKYIIS